MRTQLGKCVSAVLTVMLIVPGALALAPDTPAGAQDPTPLYAQASGGQTSGSCPLVAPCTLSYALSQVAPGGTVELVTAGGPSTTYTGGFDLDTPGTSAGQPVTIQPEPGLASAPILSGQNIATVIDVQNNGFYDLTGLTVEDASGTDGGGISDNDGGNLTVTDSTFSDNAASIAGGAIACGDDAGSCTLSISGSTFSGNSVPESSATPGGAISVGSNGGTGTVAISDSTFAGNSAIIGGAIGDLQGHDTLTITGSNFSSNSAFYGGAIETGYAGAGTATITDSTFEANGGPALTGGAAEAGGAIENGLEGTGSLSIGSSTFTANKGVFGGAITNGLYGTGTATVTDSTFSANAAGNPTVTQGTGGAISNNLHGNGSTFSVVSSTFSGNTAYTDGGAIDNSGDGTNGTLTVTASTLVDNAVVTGTDLNAIDNADNALGSGYGTGTVNLSADLIAGSNSAPGSLPLCTRNGGTWTDSGYNVASDPTCLSGGAHDVALPSLSSLIGPLAANGGSTLTMLPLPGNPAAGDIPDPVPGLCPVPADQRGVASLAGESCTAGSVQVTAPTAPTDVSATDGNGFVSASWQPPTSVGGGAVSGYTDCVTAAGGGTPICHTLDAPATNDTFSGLTNGAAYDVSVAATNWVGTGPAAEAGDNPVTPTALAPLFSSQDSAAAGAGKAFRFTVRAAGTSTQPKAPASTITETGLPAWLSMPATCVTACQLTGTVPATGGGNYSFDLQATNAYGSTTQTFTLQVLQITSAPTTTFVIGQPGSFTVTSNDTPAAPTFSVVGSLPAGATLNNNGDGTATLSGITSPPAKSHSFAIAASEGGVTTTQAFTLVVQYPLSAEVPVFSSASNASTGAGDAFRFTVRAAGTATQPKAPAATITETGLPAWLSMPATCVTTCQLTGTVPATGGGSYSFDLQATNAYGSTTQTFTLQVLQITSAPTTTFVIGQPGSFTVTSNDTPAAPTFSVVGSLPAGATLTDNGDGTATLSGTLSGAAKTFTVGIAATLGAVTTTQVFTLVVQHVPVFTSASVIVLTEGQSLNFTVKATGPPAPDVTESGAPGWVTLSPSPSGGTATLTGTAPNALGFYQFTLTATNAAGQVDQTFSLFVT